MIIRWLLLFNYLDLLLIIVPPPFREAGSLTRAPLSVCAWVCVVHVHMCVWMHVKPDKQDSCNRELIFVFRVQNTSRLADHFVFSIRKEIYRAFGRSIKMISTFVCCYSGMASVNLGLKARHLRDKRSRAQNLLSLIWQITLLSCAVFTEKLWTNPFFLPNTFRLLCRLARIQQLTGDNDSTSLYNDAIRVVIFSPSFLSQLGRSRNTTSFFLLIFYFLFLVTATIHLWLI